MWTRKPRHAYKSSGRNGAVASIYSPSHLPIAPSWDPYSTTSNKSLEKEPDIWVTVVIPEILPAHWWQSLLHNQRALLLKTALLFKDRVILIDVPFHLKR